jgi:predicted RNA-binding protein with RPS1 domain
MHYCSRARILEPEADGHIALTMRERERVRERERERERERNTSAHTGFYSLFGPGPNVSGMFYM